MLKLQNIKLSFAKQNRADHFILNNLNLNLSKGEFVIIVGANGAGKSTLFNLISGALKPDQGQIFLDQQDITRIPAANRSAAIAKVLQDPKVGTMENMTIYENLAFAAMRGRRRGLGLFARLRNRQFFQSKLAMLEMGLEHRLDDLVLNLSGGQRQALSLIMAIIADCSLLLLDEITASLDPKTAEHVMQITAEIIRSEKRTAIMITHNLQHASKYGDRTLILQEGMLNVKDD